MSKTLKGKEVWQALLDGKKIKGIGWERIKWVRMLDDGRIIHLTDDECADLAFTVSSLAYEIYEEPKEKPLIEYSPRYQLTIVADSNYFNYHEQESFYLVDSIKWKDALYTFMRLKGHPLARKIKKSHTQWFLSFDPRYTGLSIMYYQSLQNKIDSLSSFFDSEKDALCAIEDIGQENIINMFKVFGGVE